MGVYSASIITPAAGANAPFADLRNGASQRLYVREIGVFTTAATATSVGLVRPATFGTASTTTAGQQEDPADTNSAALIGCAWSTAPTLTAAPVYLRRVVLPAQIGAGVIWTWPDEALVVPVSSAIALWNFAGAAGSALAVYLRWEE